MTVTSAWLYIRLALHFSPYFAKPFVSCCYGYFQKPALKINLVVIYIIRIFTV